MKSSHFSVRFARLLLAIFKNFKFMLLNIQKKISDVYYAIACNYLSLDLFVFSLWFIFFKMRNRYKYRRDCVTHMKRKHSNTVTGNNWFPFVCLHSNDLIGSISQYIQKLNDSTKSHHCIQPSTSTPNNNNLNALIEPKRYGCPYCSLMTKSTSSIYKHQSRKHASFPKIVHKYSTDDPNSRCLVAVLKQKTVKSLNWFVLLFWNQWNPIEPSSLDEIDLTNPSIVSSSSSASSFINQSTNESMSVVNRHRCAASKHIVSSLLFVVVLFFAWKHLVQKTAHSIHSSNGRLTKVFQCSLCTYRARHRSNVVRHVKNLHSIDFDESNPIENSQNDDNREQMPNYSLNTTVQAPLILNETNQSTKPYADIHLSINIFLPKKFQRQQTNSISEQILSDCSTDEDLTDDNDDNENQTKIQISSSLPSNSLYKPHKCRRCFYRSNWKTDMLHHIRLKHHINYANKSDYISMDYESALHSFSTYEKTFGKVLKSTKRSILCIEFFSFLAL